MGQIRLAGIGEARPLRVAVTGASGLVGTALAASLEAAGHTVVRLVRRKGAGPGHIYWNPVSGEIDREGLEGLDAFVHLAGENVAGGRWTRARKEAIRGSRVDGTSRIAETLASLTRPPESLIAASAIGYYGDRGEEELDESSAPGTGFLAQTCVDWEAASDPAERAGLRVVRLRIGIVLAAAGGALRRMLPPFRLGIGGPLGSGRQFTSWIALVDLVGVIHAAIHDPSLRGAVNAVAPEPVRNARLSRALARVLRRPCVFFVPAVAIRLRFGEMGQALLLASTRVRPRRLEQTVFHFRYADLESALRFELASPSAASHPTSR